MELRSRFKLPQRSEVFGVICSGSEQLSKASLVKDQLGNADHRNVKGDTHAQRSWVDRHGGGYSLA